MNGRCRRPGIGIVMLAAALLTGCASLPGKRAEPVGDRQLEYVLARHERRDAPTVVFENGLGGTLDWWAKVFPEVARDSTAFAYNRPGYGASAPSPAPRDGGHIVDELRAALRARGLAPPYVLVGHSLGGLYMQLFARRYPEEVRGLVLVDSTHPEQLRGRGSPDDWPLWVRLGVGLATSAVAREEMSLIDGTGAELLALPPFTGRPVVVLSARDAEADRSARALDAREKRADIVRLHPGARQIRVDSGHAIPLEKPGAVVAAIGEVLAQEQETGREAATGERPWK